MTALNLSTLRLAKGSHSADDGEVCFVEAFNVLRGNPKTDKRPPDVSRILHVFSISINDGFGDEARQMLVPFVPRIAGTAGQSGADERAGYLCLDWLIRTYTPAWLRLAGLHAEADVLSGSVEITDLVTAGAVADHVRAASEKSAAARDAARAAAGDAARAAAEAAARAAARAAAWAAAGAAAGNAARAAAWAAAGAAAWAAAEAAAGDAARDAARAAAGAPAGAAAWAAAAAAQKLAPTVTELQASAIDLFGRILGCYTTTTAS